MGNTPIATILAVRLEKLRRRLISIRTFTLSLLIIVQTESGLQKEEQAESVMVDSLLLNFGEKKIRALCAFLADFTGQPPPMNLDMPLAWNTIGGMGRISCRMGRNETRYLRVLLNFCPCIPISIPRYQLKMHSHQQSKPYHRIYTRQVQRTSLSNSKSAIWTDFIRTDFIRRTDSIKYFYTKVH